MLPLLRENVVLLTTLFSFSPFSCSIFYLSHFLLYSPPPSSFSLSFFLSILSLSSSLIHSIFQSVVSNGSLVRVKKMTFRSPNEKKMKKVGNLEPESFFRNIRFRLSNTCLGFFPEISEKRCFRPKQIWFYRVTWPDLVLPWQHANCSKAKNY